MAGDPSADRNSFVDTIDQEIINGDFHKLGYPKMDGMHGKILLKGMIWIDLGDSTAFINLGKLTAGCEPSLM